MLSIPFPVLAKVKHRIWIFPAQKYASKYNYNCDLLIFDVHCLMLSYIPVHTLIVTVIILILACFIETVVKVLFSVWFRHDPWLTCEAQWQHLKEKGYFKNVNLPMLPYVLYIIILLTKKLFCWLYHKNMHGRVPIHTKSRQSSILHLVCL